HKSGAPTLAMASASGLDRDAGGLVPRACNSFGYCGGKHVSDVLPQAIGAYKSRRTTANAVCISPSAEDAPYLVCGAVRTSCDGYRDGSTWSYLAAGSLDGRIDQRSP